MIEQQQVITPMLAYEHEWRDLYRAHGLTEQTTKAFQQVIYHHYHLNRRSFSWREIISPYRVVVSEVMLQQTQTHRVAQKFDQFVEQFPDFATLAAAPFDEVLRYWKGLGYNRRALNLQKIAQHVVTQHAGVLPNDPDELVKLPGIGKATASSICAFTFDRPTIFIETNIRTVFIHFFFNDQAAVHDADLMPLIAAMLDRDHPRHWYYALMDYGVMLKKTVGNLCKQSKHYARQSTFQGSDRQLRGRVLQALLDYAVLDQQALLLRLACGEERLQKIVCQLEREGFIVRQQGMMRLA